jgi:hypothetical protein
MKLHIQLHGIKYNKHSLHDLMQFEVKGKLVQLSVMPTNIGCFCDHKRLKGLYA